MLSDFVSRFLSAFFPERCVFCGKVKYLENSVCVHCAQNAERIEKPVCPKCGRGVKNCDCRRRERYFSALCAPFYFEGVVRRGVHRFKFRNAVRNAEAFSLMMAECVRENYPDVSFDCVVGVPMIKADIKARGYDQCAILSQGVAKHLGLVYDGTIIETIYKTKSQHSLKAIMRTGNLTGVFAVTDASRVEGKTLLLCDDVSTSGETLNECSKMLYLAGAKKIYCAVLALAKK